LKVGDEYLYIWLTYPLERFFNDDITTPAKHWNLTSLSTSENRGYFATWAIKNNALYLVSIDTCRIIKKGFWFWKKEKYQECSVTDLFPEAVNGEIKAPWFSGSITAHTSSTDNPADDRLVVRID